MRTISIISLKGGVAKTTTSVNMAYELHRRGFKVLLIDNDKQGNASKAFDLYDPEDGDTIAKIMGSWVREAELKEIIKNTRYEGLDVITANMNLQGANWKMLTEMEVGKEKKLENALKYVNKYYDFCVIDNAPDINMSILNAIVVTDDVIVPIVIDQYSFDGLDVLEEQLKNIERGTAEKGFKPCCLITQSQRNDVNEQGEELLRKVKPVYKQKIRRTEKKPQESTFAKIPLIEYSVRCGASQDYKKFVTEYLTKITFAIE